jgi:hypothetical protein
MRAHGIKHFNKAKLPRLKMMGHSIIWVLMI